MLTFHNICQIKLLRFKLPNLIQGFKISNPNNLFNIAMRIYKFKIEN